MQIKMESHIRHREKSYAFDCFIVPDWEAVLNHVSNKVQTCEEFKI